MKNHWNLLIAAFTFTIAPTSFAAKKTEAKKPSVTTAEKSDGKVIWDRWYTVTQKEAKGSQPYSYYNERVELRGDEVQLQVNLTKVEEGFLIEEHYGGISTATPEVTPLLFHFERKYKGHQMTVDISRQPNKALRFKVDQTGQKPSEVTRMYSEKTFFVSFFPVWLGARLSDWKPGQTQSFSALLEDSDREGFPVMNGLVTLEASDERSKKTNTHKLMVTFMDQKSTWYVRKDGSAVRIEYGKQTVEESTKEKASRFLSKPDA